MNPIKVMLVLVKTLGDIMLIHNLVDGIFKKFGEVEIDVFVNESYRCLLEGNNKISNIYTEKDWFNNWDKVIDIASSNKYDEVLIPQQLHPEDNVWHQLEEYRHQHLVDFYLHRCRLPKRDDHERLQLYTNNVDNVGCEKFIDKNELDNFIVIHTTTLVPGKNWDKFPELVNSVSIPTVQVGKKTDLLIMGVIDAREQLTIPQIGLLAARAKCFVGLDSGLSYVATAADAKVIVIQGSTIPQTSGPWGENVMHIISDTKCEIRCHGNCKYNNKCINTIKVERVLEVIKKMKVKEEGR